MVEHFLDFDGHCLSGPEFSAFVEPSIDDEVHAAVVVVVNVNIRLA